MNTALSHQQLLRILSNPTLFPGALTANEAAGQFHWHDCAHMENSSQMFCVSAFGSLRHFPEPVRNAVLHHFLTLEGTFQLFETKSQRPRSWRIALEAEMPELLNEYGGQPTSIDVLLTSSEEIVCVEAKFDRDAADGFGKCSQVKDQKCAGFFGPGSDKKTKTSAWCRLENLDGNRTPRLYWDLGRRYFRPEVFLRQTNGESCPYLSQYQLMRNFLTAATLAEREGKSSFAVLTISPQHRANLFEKQLVDFRDRILRTEYQNRVKLASYESYVSVLRSTEIEDVVNLANFLQRRIDALIGKDEAKA